MTISPAMWEIFRKLVRIPPKNPFPGKVAVIWAKAHPEIEALVREEKIQPIQVLSGREALAPPTATAEQSALFWWRPDGGWPLPHFHLGDKIFPATDKQWNTFSAQVLTKAGANLQLAKTQAKVSFEDFVQSRRSPPSFSLCAAGRRCAAPSYLSSFRTPPHPLLIKSVPQ